MNETTQTTTGPRLWLRIVFGISLALNLLVIGLVVGAVVRFGGIEGRRPPPHSMGAAMYRELPQADRKALREASQRRTNHSMESRVAEADAIAAALQADPFDRGAVQVVLDEQAQHRIGWQKTAQLAWLDRVSQMSVSNRSDYADRLRDSLTWHRGSAHRGRWGKHGD